MFENPKKHWILRIFTNFCPNKIDLSGFQKKITKLPIFGTFNELLSASLAILNETFSVIFKHCAYSSKISLDSDWKCKTCLGLVFNRKIIFMSSFQWFNPDLMGELCEKLCDDDRVTPSIICTFSTIEVAKSRSNTFSPGKVGLHQIPFIIPFTMHKYLTI